MESGQPPFAEIAGGGVAVRVGKTTDQQEEETVF
jgi:hypothetical protein